MITTYVGFRSGKNSEFQWPHILVSIKMLSDQKIEKATLKFKVVIMHLVEKEWQEMESVVIDVHVDEHDILRSQNDTTLSNSFRDNLKDKGRLLALDFCKENFKLNT